MEPCQQDLHEMLDIIQQADIEYLQVETRDYKLTVSKNGRFLGEYQPAPDGEVHHHAGSASAGQARVAQPASAAPPAEAGPPTEAGPPAEAAPAAALTRATSAPAGAAAAETTAEAAVPAGTQPADGRVAIPAPVLGVFCRRPEPGANPFVEVGTRVETDATVALIEVMKMFSAVTSPVAGVIEAILASEEQVVEHGQELFVIRPEA